MSIILAATTLLFAGTTVALLIKFRAANHTAKTLLEKLKAVATNLDETQRDLASANLTLDAMRIERTSEIYQPSANGFSEKDKPNHSSENKKRRYYRKPKN
jgi:hypothetical protein